MKYLIAGTGGVGGSIAGFLSLAGKDVTCIARGAHLQAIQTNGLKLKSDLKGEHALAIPAMNAEEFNGKADVIFVCVKGYSVDSITELIKRASHDKTVVIPILNVYGTGPRIQRLVPGVTVLDGCIYIVYKTKLKHWNIVIQYRDNSILIWLNVRIIKYEGNCRVGYNTLFPCISDC